MGGPSLTSKAREAELNAAAAARARVMGGELEDMSELPSSQPISLADFTTRSHTAKKRSKVLKKPRYANKFEPVESFKRPNRPVDRYFPPPQPLQPPQPPPGIPPAAPPYPYPPQYADPRMPMHGCGPYPHPAPYPAMDYYNPWYQSPQGYQNPQGYQQMWPNYMNGYGSPAAPPAGPPPPVPYHCDAVPYDAVPPAATPAKSSEEFFTPMKWPNNVPTPMQPPVPFQPQDLSPSKVEEDITRSKALTSTPPVHEQQDQSNVQQNIDHIVSSAKSAHEKEDADDQDDQDYQDAMSFGHNNSEGPRSDGPNRLLKSHTQHAEIESPSQNTRRFIRSNQLAMQEIPKLGAPLSKLNDSVLMEETPKKQPFAVIPLRSVLAPVFKPQSDVVPSIKTKTTTKEQQQSASDNVKQNGTPPDLNMVQKDDPMISHPSVEKHDAPPDVNVFQKDDPKVSHPNVEQRDTPPGLNMVQKDDPMISHPSVEKHDAPPDVNVFQKDDPKVSHPNVEQRDTPPGLNMVQKDDPMISHPNVEQHDAPPDLNVFQKGDPEISHPTPKPNEDILPVTPQPSSKPNEHILPATPQPSSKPDEPIIPATPISKPKRLQSPFQLRARPAARPLPAVQYYNPIINNYPKNVFATEYSRQEELRKIDNGNAWRELEHWLKLEKSPSRFKRFWDSPSLADENSKPPMIQSNIMPPPGFAVAGAQPLPYLVPRNTAASRNDSHSRASAYYDRVLDAENWFHQSIYY